MNKKIIPVFIVLFFLVLQLNAQSLIDKDPYQSRVISKHYSKDELQFLESNYPEKFKKIKYYYLYSFIIIDLNCSTCKKYNADLIDVIQYNNLRKENERVSITNEEYGYKIILLSQREVELMIKNDNRNIETKQK